MAPAVPSRLPLQVSPAPEDAAAYLEEVIPRSDASRRGHASSGIEAINLPSGQLATKVIYIHGMGPHDPPVAVKKAYDEALFGLNLADKTQLAYYADILHSLKSTVLNETVSSNGAEVTAASVLGTVSKGLTSKEAFAQEEWTERLIAKMRSEAVLSRSDGEIEAFVQGAAIRSRSIGPESTDPLSASSIPLDFHAEILPAFPFRSRLTEQFLRQFTPDVAAYFFQQEVRAKMQARLRDLLIPGGGPYVVVAHSLGTIISFEVLSSLGNSIDIPLWITLGSPLGISEVQELFVKNDEELVIPAGVGTWVNVAALLDPVAADSTVADDYAGTNDRLIIDHQIVNRDSLRFSGFNPHSSTGYLSNAFVQQAVRSELATDFTSPTSEGLMARDLARTMGESAIAIPILVELRQLAGKSIEDVRTQVRQAVISLADSASNRSAEDQCELDELDRYISAKLTPRQIRQLELQLTGLPVFKIWKNAERRALLDVSSQRIHAGTARISYNADGDGIGWAVLDTGIAEAHPHFTSGGVSNIASQWDCTLRGLLAPGGKATDESGHGTHVAGIIAGKTPQHLVTTEMNYVGISPAASLHIYKVLDRNGRGQDSYIIKALDHVASVNEQAGRLVIHGVNLSLGGPFNPEDFGCGHSPICKELRRLWRMGVIVCVAAGNEGQLSIDIQGQGYVPVNFELSIGDPANLEEAIAVGSVHKDDPQGFGVSYFSSKGPTSDGRQKPDVVAPGEKIFSCNAKYTPTNGQSPYVQMSGTSMACPHISGLLAAFLSVRKGFVGRPDEVKKLLVQHAMDLGRTKQHQGAGLPNLIKMLQNT